MPRKYIKRLLPKPDVILKQRALKIFGNLLYNANLWALNRRSAAGAFAVGLAVCFIPLPSQMIIAAGLAILFRVNLPLSVALVWISNPVTMPPMFYGAYKLGAWVLQEPPVPFHFELSWDYLVEMMNSIGPAFLLGCAICSIVFSVLGYFSIHLLWRYSVVRSWNKRRLRLPRIKLKKPE
ncbi:hypothetical protein VST7929_01638 [Vibrio stylophorae]|uniref:DUF2062 domain-containing protein n=1 Tax=Vibrio stylophorae TaxID=659351 RepID=A0ABM8ZTV7_9VIBR|nr:DUF2062 domain-containing protein [Vibrio stylophorae]CAH0533763.1 hypothetical protein VST7929_01638 [Vibrio stylophorae]